MDGVKLLQDANGKKIKFLRRVPMDPMTNSRDWGFRSMQDDPNRRAGDGRIFSTFTQEHGPGARWNAVCGVVMNADRRGSRRGNKGTQRFVGGQATGSGPLFRGYTLIELIIVMAIISILLATAVPMYQKSLTRTKESLLKNNLFTLRTVIDEYTFDKQKAPQTLQDLVDQGYLRGVPLDPITGAIRPGGCHGRRRFDRRPDASRGSMTCAADPI